MISVRLEHDLENKLSLVSRQHHTSKSQIIKEALSLYFETLAQESQTKSSYELGEALFGKYGSQETTLSTTYKQKIKEKIYAKNAHR